MHISPRHTLPFVLPFLSSTPPRTLPPRLQFATTTVAEPKLADFSVQGGPQIISPAPHDSKPILLYLPGIELSGYSLHRQVEPLQQDFDVRWLAVPADDRSNFTALVSLVGETIDAEQNRSVYLVGESFGGVLALSVALRDGGDKPPPSLAGVVLINPATSVLRSWPAQLQPVLDGVGSLPAGASTATYLAIATPIFSAISGDPLQLGSRRGDEALPLPLRLPTTLGRLAAQIPELTALPSALPLETLAYRLPMLLDAAKHAETLKKSQLKLPVQIIASSEDKVLPSVDEGRKLARALPNAKLTTLEGSGHVPLLEARVNLATILRDAKLLERKPLGRPKDYVTDFTLPTAEQFANASKSLSTIRKLTSPIFLSTKSDGRRVSGLSGLPTLGGGEQSTDAPAPVLFIGNHQLYGFLDLPVLVEEVHRVTGSLIRGLSHPVAFSSNGRAFVEADDAPKDTTQRRGGGFVDFETFGAVPVSPRALFKLLKNGDNVLLYPGGVREAFKSTKKGEGYKLFWPDSKESSDFVPVAARFNATIVPVAAIGAEEGFEMVLDADELLELPYLGERAAESAKRAPVGRPGERFVTPVSVPKLPGRYYFLFGEPVDASQVDPNDKEACAALYEKVQKDLERDIAYLLEARKQDKYEGPLPRLPFEASWNFTKQAPSFAL